MKTSTPINISGRVYYIDTDAKDLLTEYMTNISYAFQGPEQAEIVSDIENRVHELLTEKCRNRDMMEAVTIEDVRDVISIIGRPEEMVEEEYVDIRVGQGSPSNGAQDNFAGNTASGHSANPNANCQGNNQGSNDDGSGANNFTGGANASGAATPPPYHNPGANGNCNPSGQGRFQKKYFRDPEHAVFGGVIAGLGYYTGFSVPLMRFLLVVFSLLFGYFQWPILLYIIAWIIFPAAKTAKERLEMMGQEVTVSSIGDTVTGCPPSNPAANVQNAGQPQQYSTLGQIAIVFAKVCLAILALICIPIGIGMLIGAVVCLTMLLACLFGYASQIAIDLSIPYAGFGLGIAFMVCLTLSLLCFGVIWAAACVLFNAKPMPRKAVIITSVITLVLITLTIIAIIAANIMDIAVTQF